MQLPPFITRSLGWAAFEFARLQPFIPTYLHLIASALFPIYTGAHASLSRPSSAAKKPKKKRRNEKGDGAESDDEDEEEPSQMEGLSPGDAIVFPILAGTTLTGLYFLIKWLDNTELINKLLNWYFAGFSVFAVSRLVSDGLDVFHSVLFPHDFVDRGKLFHVDWKRQQVTAASDPADTRISPLPGIFSRLPLPESILNSLWTLHVLPTRKLQFKAVIRKILHARVPLGIHGLEGLIVGLSTVLWYNFISKPWPLTNLMGFGFAYGTLQLMSPTTFWTGTMILSGLFVYDIVMVFMTPMMVTVAKSVDIPIKLLFPRPPGPDDTSTVRAMSMLGLGDVVLPGIVVGLALRFDLFMHYLRKQTKKGDEVVKADYQSVAEGWGDRIWTSSLLTGWSRQHGYLARNAFPKPYFHASLVGYTAGMLATLGAMQISERPQPALLYLVPGVLASLWGTAWLKGEVKQMWEFSEATEEDKTKAEKQDEAGEDDEEDKSKSRSKQKSIFSAERSEARAKRMGKSFAEDDESSSDRGGEELKSKSKSKSKSRSKAQDEVDDRTLVSFSVTLPPARTVAGVWTADTQAQSPSKYNLRSKDAKSPERAEKRQRVS